MTGKPVFGGPAISRGVPFPTTEKPPFGVFIELDASGSSSSKDLFPFLVQNYSFQLSERIQEVYTLSETNHLYTFGNNLARLSISGFFIHPGVGSWNSGDTSKEFYESYNSIRAKKSGEEGETLVKVRLNAFGKSFDCVLVSASFSQSAGNEVLVSTDLSFIVMDPQEDDGKKSDKSGAGSGVSSVAPPISSSPGISSFDSPPEPRDNSTPSSQAPSAPSNSIQEEIDRAVDRLVLPDDPRAISPDFSGPAIVENDLGIEVQQVTENSIVKFPFFR